jgi:hypothetical protein
MFVSLDRRGGLKGGKVKAEIHQVSDDLRSPEKPQKTGGNPAGILREILKNTVETSLASVAI